MPIEASKLARSATSATVAEPVAVGRRAGELRWIATAALALLSLSTLGCKSTAPLLSGNVSLALPGTQLEYRFESGHRYRVCYEDDLVSFELLEPVLADPPKRTLPYQATQIRDGLFLVSWDDIEFAPVFVIDLEGRKIHTRAQRKNGDTFFATAEIMMLSRE